MELRHLRYFVAVAEELHFGRAAARLHISQPPLSKQIQQLELELRVKLLIRNKHKVELTPSGRTFLSHARQLLSGVAEAVDVARRVDRGEIAQLKIGHTHSADLKALPQLLSAFRRRYACVGITLRRSNAPDLVAAIHRHDFDLGVIRLPASCHGLNVIPIRREALIVALPANHPLAAYRSVPIPALAGEPQILFPRHHAPGYFDLLASICERAGFVMKISQISDSIQSTLSLVSMGFGVSLQPECVQELARAGVVFRSLEGDVPPLDMAMICRPDDTSEIVDCLISVAEELRDQFISGLKSRRRAAAGGFGSE